MILICSVLFTISCSVNKDVDIADYPLVMDVKELSQNYNLNIDTSGKHETTSITKYYEGTVELNYKYELIESEEYQPFYYDVTVVKSRTKYEADERYFVLKGALNITNTIIDQEIVEIDSIQLPGDDTYYAWNYHEEMPLAMIYLIRKGRFIYSVHLAGIHITDHSILTEIILPRVQYLEDFEVVKGD